MKSLPETFKNCSTVQWEQKCPICQSKLYNKRLRIDEDKFRGVKKLGITHKAVNFCSNPECTFLEQGIIYIKETYERFLSLKEIDDFIRETIESSFIRKSSDEQFLKTE